MTFLMVAVNAFEFTCYQNIIYVQFAYKQVFFLSLKYLQNRQIMKMMMKKKRKKTFRSLKPPIIRMVKQAMTLKPSIVKMVTERRIMIKWKMKPDELIRNWA